MKLRITVADPAAVRLDLLDRSGSRILYSHHFSAEFNLSERLPAEIKRLLARRRVLFSQLSAVEVSMQSQRFSRQRTAAAAANALNFALHPKAFKSRLVRPIYASAARITLSNKHRSHGI